MEIKINANLVLREPLQKRNWKLVNTDIFIKGIKLRLLPLAKIKIVTLDTPENINK